MSLKPTSWLNPSTTCLEQPKTLTILHFPLGDPAVVKGDSSQLGEASWRLVRMVEVVSGFLLHFAAFVSQESASLLLRFKLMLSKGD